MSKDYIKTGRVNQKQETRGKILLSAQYFLNKGEEFNLEDIAKKTGISRATVYRYFSNIDTLAAEASLDINTKSPEAICKDIDTLDIRDQVIHIQEYYNTLTLDNEKLFRKFLSTTLDNTTSIPKRGARRKKTLQLVLDKTNDSREEQEALSNLLTLMMGMEPLIVTKDVCGLDSTQSKKLLRWGVELILDGYASSKKS